MAFDPRTDYSEFNAEAREIWEHNARWWDDRMAEGNRWHLLLIAPAVERLLNIQRGERVLDLACGNGLFSRRLAQLGASVLACDVSPSFLECARSRTTKEEAIDYRLMDLTDEEQLATLGGSEFDAALCNMALMDIATITPLLRTVRKALKNKGRFVFSILHPCFHNMATSLLAERDESEIELTYSVRIKQYRHLQPQKGIGIVGQPQPHYYFHRTLTELLTACFANGFVLDGIEEPGFEPLREKIPGVTFEHCTEIPPILAARMRMWPAD